MRLRRAAVAAGAALVFGAPNAAGAGAPGEEALQEPVELRTSIAPTRVLFGDVPRAELRVVIDRRRVDLATLDVRAGFRLYTRIATGRSRRDAGFVTELRYRFGIACLEPACVPKLADTLVAVGTARARYRLRPSGARREARAKWPDLRVSPRFTSADNPRAPFDPGLERLAPVSYERSQRAVTLPLAFLGAFLLLAGATAVGTAYWRVVGGARDRAPARALPPLTYALLLVRSSLRHGGRREQRRALELLARELTAIAQVELAARARRIAWSREGPPAGADALCRDVEHAVGGST